MDMSSMVAAALADIKAGIEANNALATQIKAAGNTKSLVHEIRDEAETTDETILKYRAQREKALAALAEWESQIEKYILDAGLVKVEEFDIEAAKVTWKADADKIKAASKLVVTLGGSLEGLPEVVGIPGTRSAGAASQTGTRRPRLAGARYSVAGTEEWQDVSETTGEGAEAVTKTSFTLLAKALSTKEHTIKPSDLHAPLFKEAGTEDLNTLEGKPVSFGFTVGDVNYIVEVTPRVETA